MAGRTDTVVGGLVAALGFAAALALVGQLLGYTYGRDHGIFAVVAHRVLDGAAPYRDVWDYKPPAIYLLFMLTRAVLGPAQVAIRVVESVALLGLAIPFAWLARRLVGDARAAFPALALALLAYVRLGFWHTGQPDGFGAILVIWGLVGAMIAADPLRAGGARNAGAVCAGLAYGAATMFKPTLALPLVISAAAIALSLRSGPRRAMGLPILLMGASYAVPVLAMAGWLLATGAWSDAQRALFIFAPAHAELGAEQSGLVVRMLRALGDLVAAIQPWGTLGAIGLVALPTEGVVRRETRHAFAVVAAGLFGVAVQAMFFRYHYALCALLLGALGGFGAWRAVAAWRAGAVRRETLLGLVALTLIVSGTGGTGGTKVDEKDTGRAPSRSEANRRANAWSPEVATETAAWIQANTPADASIYIWGYEPGIYEIAQRRPSSRFIYNEPMRVPWSGAGNRKRLMDDLGRDPPAVIVVQHDDVFPFLTGNDWDSARALADFRQLNDLIQNTYVSTQRFGYLEVFVPKPPPQVTPNGGW